MSTTDAYCVVCADYLFLLCYVFIILYLHRTYDILLCVVLLIYISWSSIRKALCCIYLCIPLVGKEVVWLWSGGKRFGVAVIFVVNLPLRCAMNG